jgi:hypothetical protein
MGSILAVRFGEVRDITRSLAQPSMSIAPGKEPGHPPESSCITFRT